MKRIKNIISLLVLLVCSAACFAQTFPNNINQSNSATKTTFPGSVNTALQNRYFTDTTAANGVPYLKFTPHIQIKVGESIYVRNTAATAWLLQANLTNIDSIININNNNYFGNCVPKVLSGSVTIDSLFAGRTTDITFQMATCSTYNVSATTFNITGSGIADRYTIVIADTLGNIGTIDGGTNPADIPNIVDDESQILLAVYFIPAGSTTPQDVSSEWIYREGDNDWLNIRGTVTTGFDSAYTTNPFAGLLSLRIPSMVAGQYYEWHFGGLKTAADYEFFTAHLRKAGVIAKGTKWSITFYNGNSIATSNAAVITDGSYGYNNNVQNAYESIAVPFTAWNFINPLFDRVRVRFIGSTSVSTQWDNVKLQAGGGNTNGGNFVQTVNGVGGANVNIRVLDSTYLNADSSRQVFINTYTGDTISAQTFVNYIYFDTCFNKTTVGKNTYVTFNQNCGGSGGGITQGQLNDTAAAIRADFPVAGSGTVTDVAALTLGTTGTDLNSSVASGTTTPVITLNVPTASASNRGALAASDWTLFNAKQAAISVTSPITLTGVSVGMVNQGTATTVLHGNASGNPSFSSIVNADITNSTIDLTTKVTGILPVSNGGTGTATPSITAGTNITSVTGTWPNVTINAATQGGGGSYTTSGPITLSGTNIGWDSLNFHKARFTYGDSVIAGGDSYTVGDGASNVAHAWVNIFGNVSGLPILNKGFQTAGLVQLFYTSTVNTGKPWVVLAGFNEAIKGGARIRNLEKIKGGYQAFLANIFSSTSTAASAVTATGTWAATSGGTSFPLKATTIGGTGMTNKVIGDKLTYSFSGSSFFMIFEGVDSAAHGSRSADFKIVIDNTDTTYYTSNNLSYAYDDFYWHNTWAPNAIVRTDLSTGSHTAQVINTTNDSLFIDCFGTLKSPLDATSVMIGSVPKLGAVAYAGFTITAGVPVNDGTMDSCSSSIMEAIRQFPGYPITWVDVNSYFKNNVAVDLYHPNDTGHARIAQAYLYSLNTKDKGLIPADGIDGQLLVKSSTVPYDFGWSSSITSATNPTLTLNSTTSGVSPLLRYSYSGIPKWKLGVSHPTNLDFGLYDSINLKLVLRFAGPSGGIINLGGDATASTTSAMAINNASININQPVQAITPTTIPIIAKAAASQTASFQEWQNSSSTVLGKFYMPSANTTAMQLHGVSSGKEAAQAYYDGPDINNAAVGVTGISTSGGWYGLTGAMMILSSKTGSGTQQPMYFGGYNGSSLVEWMRLTTAGRLSLGFGATPTAWLHIKAGSAAASSAPLKFTSGTNLTTPEAGAVEFDGTNYFATSSTTRYTLAKTLTNTATLNFDLTAVNYEDLTITVTGAVDGDAVIVGAPNGAVVADVTYFGWVSGTNTVTIRCSRVGGGGAADPASGTFRASVTKY